MERDDRLSYFAIENTSNQFIGNLYFKESSYNLPERFYHVLCALGQKAFDYFYSGDTSHSYQYTISVFGINGSRDKVFEGVIHSLGDLHDVIKGLTVLFLDYVILFLKVYKPNIALRHCYHFHDSIKEAMIFETSNRNNVFKDFLENFLELIQQKIIFYERLIKLNQYDQFIRLKQPLDNDAVVFWKLSENELTEIAEFYLGIISPLKGQSDKNLMKNILIEIFNGKSQIDYLILEGKKYQIADTFLQLYKNGKIRCKTKADFVNWVNNKFRLFQNDQFGYIGSALQDLLKGNGQPPTTRRLYLPSFLDYYLYNKAKKEFIPQKR